MTIFSLKIPSRLFLLICAVALVIRPAWIAAQGAPAEKPLPPTQALFRTAYDYFQAGAPDQALAAFRQFLKTEPNNILRDYALFYAGRSLLQTSRYEDARQTFAQLQATQPQSLLLPEAAFLAAESYARQGRCDLAIPRYLALKEDKRFEGQPWLPESYLNLGRCYEQAKQFSAARNIYHQAQLTFIAHPRYQAAKEREAALLKQYPALQNEIPPETLLKDVDQLLKAGRAADAAPLLTKLAGAKLSAALRPKILLRLAQAYYSLRENQRALTAYQQFLAQNPASAVVPSVLNKMGRLHLRRRDWPAFLQIYAALRAKYPKDRYTADIMRLKGEELELQGQFQDALAEYTACRQLFPAGFQAAEMLWHLGWVNYQLRRYDGALQAFEQLGRAAKSAYREEALYWEARAAEQLQKYAQAGNAYLKISAARPLSYYGALSQCALAQLRQQQPILKLSVKPPPALKPLDFETAPTYTKEIAIFHRTKAAALAEMGLFQQAAAELAAAVANDAPEAAKYLELARLYRQAGAYHQLARLMRIRFGDWIERGDARLPPEFWELAYPLSFQPIITQHAAASGLDPFFVMALMLAESLFDPAAYSPAGAMGLMQLMPQTGARLAQALNLPPPAPEQYFQPEINILLGVAYLKELGPRFHQQLLPVIASYNAGEDAAQTWWRDQYQADLPAFVARIPYQETKRYVQRVMAYYQEYQRIYPAGQK